VAALGKPMIFSTGVASEDDIVLALNAARAQGNHAIAVLKCTSAYPTAPDQANLRVIASMADRYNVVAGLSDHTLGITAPVAAVSLGAGIIEKHLMLSSDVISEDRHFSLDEFQFKEMVDAVRTTERMLGSYQGLPDPSELEAHRYRRSLFVSRDIHAGERLTRDNIRSVRPGVGLHPKHLPVNLNRQAARDLRKGTPLEATAVLGFSV
ncbi:MAG: N-acetylneuraminate synthase family protein, partial [Pseudomonadota bacterium]